MSLGKIIGIAIAIPAMILTLIPMFIQFWAEGIVTDTLMNAFSVHPVIAALLTVAGLVVFVIAVIRVSGSIL